MRAPTAELMPATPNRIGDFSARRIPYCSDSGGTNSKANAKLPIVTGPPVFAPYGAAASGHIPVPLNTYRLGIVAVGAHALLTRSMLHVAGVTHVAMLPS